MKSIKISLTFKIITILTLLVVITAFPFRITIAQNQDNSLLGLEKYFSFDNGTTWLQAIEPIGPYIPAGSPVSFKFVITNNTNAPLENLELTDDVFIQNGVLIPGPITPGTPFEYLLSGNTVIAGQHGNKATVSAVYEVYQASAQAYYYGYTSQPGPSIVLKKYVSDDGITWYDAESPPGPSFSTGSLIKFKFIITNSGNVELIDLNLTDNVLSMPGLVLPASLAPGNSFEYILTNVNAIDGQHSNTATATARYGQQVVSYSDQAHYSGTKDISPLISIKKYLSVDNGETWLDAETPPGPSVAFGSPIKFKFIIINNGDLNLTDLTLADSIFDLSGAILPASLSPGNSFEYVLSGIKASTGQHINTATASGTYNQQQVSDSDKAHYMGITTFTPALELKKYVSVDGGVTWLHATEPTGPSVEVYKEVQFKFTLKNTGSVSLTELTLSDSDFSLANVNLPSSFAPGAIFEYIQKNIFAVEGQHSNTAIATGVYNGVQYRDIDRAHYYGIKVEKPSDNETPKTGGHLPSIILYFSLTLLYGLILLLGFERYRVYFSRGKH